MPRPVDSGGPPHPRHIGWFCVAFGYVKTLGIRNNSFRSCTSTSGSAISPTAYRILCLRLAHLVRTPLGDSAMDPRLDTGGWLTLTRQGLSPCKIRRASLARWPGPAAFFNCRFTVVIYTIFELFGSESGRIDSPNFGVASVSKS